MSKRFRLWVLSVCLAGILPAYAVAADNDPLQQFLQETSSFRAGFEQEIYSPTGELIELSAGTLSISRPGRFRWDYDEPAQTIIADGEKLWLYDIDLDQVTVGTQSENLVGSPAALLGGGASALDDFIQAGNFESDGLVWTRLQPKEEQSDFAAISIAFKNDALFAMELTDALNQLTRVRFLEPESNIELAPALFDFEVPEGVDLIDNTHASAAIDADLTE